MRVTLSMISGPDTIVIGRAGDSIDPSFLASRVFPHPVKREDFKFYKENSYNRK
jgi:hypothetical protein